MMTPCIKLCAIDPASGLCIRCRRTLQEIGAWARLSDDERREIMAHLPERQTAVRVLPEADHI